METTVLYNQSLLDIAIQEYGTLEAVFGLAQANALGITDTIAAGIKLQIPPTDYGSRAIAEYFKPRQIHPATASKINEETTHYAAPNYVLQNYWT